MELMTICSNYAVRPKIVEEVNDGDVFVDLELYRPLEKRLEDYIRSGENLESTRRLAYHSDMIRDLETSDFIDDSLFGHDKVDVIKAHYDRMTEIIEDIKSRKPEFSTAKPSDDPRRNVGEEAGEDVVKSEVSEGDMSKKDDVKPVVN